MTTRRNVLMRLTALGLLSPIVGACKEGGGEMGLFAKKEVVLDVVLFNYWNRAIFEVLLDGVEIGGAGPWGGGTGVMTGVTIPLGKQTLTWRWGDTGEIMVAANALNLTVNDVSADDYYLGVHIYSDNTAELTVSPHLPEKTPKGERFYQEAHNDGR